MALGKITITQRQIKNGIIAKIVQHISMGLCRRTFDRYKVLCTWTADYTIANKTWITTADKWSWIVDTCSTWMTFFFCTLVNIYNKTDISKQNSYCYGNTNFNHYHGIRFRSSFFLYYTAISIKVVPRQSGKVEYERERLLGIVNKFIHLLVLLAIPSSLSRSYSNFPLCSGDNLNWNSCIHYICFAN
jgi:hypothetical protein